MAEKIVKDSQGLAKDLVNDCISRKAAIDEVINLWADKPFGNPALVEIKDCIEKLPPAQPEQQWIPCSERLPENEDYDETFTVTIQCEHVDGWDDYVTGYADWTPHGWDIQSYYLGQIKVTAWMPLPEPYKAESEDKK